MLKAWNKSRWRNAPLTLKQLHDEYAKAWADQKDEPVQWEPGEEDAEKIIRLKGPYDIALNKTPDGSYGLTTDWWDGRVQKEVGTKFGRLLQLYGIHKTTIEARKRGHLVQRKTQRDGSIKLTIGGV